MPRVVTLSSSILYRLRFIRNETTIPAEPTPALASEPVRGAGEFTRVSPAGLLSEDRSFSRRVHQGQLIRESLTLSLNDSPIFLRFLRAVDNLDRLPRCNMQVLA